MIEKRMVDDEIWKKQKEKNKIKQYSIDNSKNLNIKKFDFDYSEIDFFITEKEGYEVIAV